MSRLSEQMIHNPSGDKPISRMPAHLNPSAIPSLPSNYLPTVNGYYSLSPASQDALTSRPIPYRVVEHGAIGAVDAERDYLNQLFEKPKAAGGTGEPPSRADGSSGLRFIDDKIIRPQRGRTVFSAKQLHELEKVFVTDQYISGQQRRRLSIQLGLTETQVRVWFQNRRIKWRKQKLERKIKP